MKITEVREFTTDAYDTILELNEILSPGATKMSETLLNEIIDSPNNHLFFISDDDCIAGMLTIGIYYTPTGKKAWIEDVVIKTEQQNKGLGKLLMQHAIDFANLAGVAQLMLTSNSKRVAANMLYKSLHFSTKETNLYRFQFE